MKVLIIDDDADIRFVAAMSLRAGGAIDVVEASGGLDGVCKAREEQPDVILLDEPCSALDPISTLKVEELINELKKDYTIVIVTHNMQQAARVSDYTAFMYLGKLVEYGPTKVMFLKPERRQTEDYITGRFG